MEKKFLEHISQIIYENPKIVKVRKDGALTFVHYDKVPPGDHDIVADCNGYQIVVKVEDDRTRISIQPLTIAKVEQGYRAIWMEVGDPYEEVVWEDHHLFKPLKAHVEKEHEKFREEAFGKIVIRFLDKNTSELDPIAQIIVAQQQAEEEPPEKVTSFGKGDTELIDFTRWHDKPKEEVEEEKPKKRKK